MSRQPGERPDPGPVSGGGAVAVGGPGPSAWPPTAPGSPGSAEAVRLTGVSLALAGRLVLDGVSLAARRGEVLVILGPSGSGKTTLLRLMAGLIAPGAGRVEVAGEPPVPGRRAATVFQSYRLLPWKTVAGNVAFALPHLPRAERRRRAAAALARVGLARFAEAWPGQLSGGMQQRVSLARALAAEPELLLMDEPFAALDAQTRELMQEELLRLMAEPGAPTVVFVTHSVDEALILGDRVLVLSARPGRVVEELAVPFARRPAGADARLHPDWPGLQARLRARLREVVMADPGSDFYRG